ncbi:hypothetical protein FQA47_016055 [Oryzias melastigma]|uniref:Uncharacterized protein n=1 Tax=Oryzias melastigma TaxID=30732 RepID=A0A834L0M0_ORYME|nr:hypothetical protein FQA47_016055 [Oryzias melastigma]
MAGWGAVVLGVVGNLPECSESVVRRTPAADTRAPQNVIDTAQKITGGRTAADPANVAEQKTEAKTHPNH